MHRPLGTTPRTQERRRAIAVSELRAPTSLLTVLTFIAHLPNWGLFYDASRNSCAPLTPNLYVHIKRNTKRAPWINVKRRTNVKGHSYISSSVPIGISRFMAHCSIATELDRRQINEWLDCLFGSMKYPESLFAGVLSCQLQLESVSKDFKMVYVITFKLDF